MSEASSRLPSRPIMVVVSLAVTVLAIWLAVRGQDLSQIGPTLAAYPVWPFLVALALTVVLTGARAVRLHVIMREMGAPFAAALETVIIGYFFTIIMPFRTGELVRIGYLARRAKVPVLSAVSASAVERAMDMTTLALLAAVFLPSLVDEHLDKFPISPNTLAVLSGSSVVFAVVVGLLVRRRLAAASGEKSGFARRLDEVLAGFTALGSISSVAIGFVMSLTAWLSLTLAIKIAFLATPQPPVSMSHAGVVLLGTCFAIALPPTPASIGTYHAGFEYAALLAGIPRKVSLPLAIVMHLLIQLPWLPVAGIILMTGGRRVLARPPREGENKEQGTRN